jgi:hypothetical protein
MARRRGFSPNRELGITKLKQKIARETGIPTTKAGRERKAKREFEKMVSGQGCLMPIFFMTLPIMMIIIAVL